MAQRLSKPVRLMLWVAALGAINAIGCEKPSTPVPASHLTVFAAASLADAFREIGAAFEAANPGARVEFSFAGSNQLRTQLELGAPADIFASADRKQMDAAVSSSVVDATTVAVFAHNHLALIVPRDNPGGIAELADLARPGVKIVVADKAVPVGNYTRLMLDKTAASPDFGPLFVTAFDANTVSLEENVAAVVTKVALGEADAGVAYASDAAGANGPKLAVITIPPEFDHRADYMIAVTSNATDRMLARVFLDFVASESGSAPLSQRGFVLPGSGAQ